MNLSPSRIVCAAIIFSDGQIVIGARHYDMRMAKTIENLKTLGEEVEQGFIDQHGTFYDREDAWIIAERNNQIINRSPHFEGTLYSENLY